MFASTYRTCGWLSNVIDVVDSSPRTNRNLIRPSTRKKYPQVIPSRYIVCSFILVTRPEISTYFNIAQIFCAYTITRRDFKFRFLAFAPCCRYRDYSNKKHRNIEARVVHLSFLHNQHHSTSLLLAILPQPLNPDPDHDLHADLPTLHDSKSTLRISKSHFGRHCPRPVTMYINHRCLPIPVAIGAR